MKNSKMLWKINFVFRLRLTGCERKNREPKKGKPALIEKKTTENTRLSQQELCVKKIFPEGKK